MTTKEILKNQERRNVQSLARVAGLLLHIPGLTIEAAAIVLGVRGAKARALRFWQRSALLAETERVSAVAQEWNNLE